MKAIFKAIRNTFKSRGKKDIAKEFEFLDTEEILKGIKKSIENGNALLDEADILRTNSKYARTFALCQLALEEYGKMYLLFTLAIDKLLDNNINYNEFYDDYISHLEKAKFSYNHHVMSFKLFEENTGNKFPEKFIENLEYIEQHVIELNVAKNDSLYVSLRNQQFIVPTDIVTEELANDIYNIALLRKLTAGAFANLTVEKLEGTAKLIKKGIT